MDKEFGSEYEPSPETIRAFSELVEREAYRKRRLEKRKDVGLLPPAAAAVRCTQPWQPRFRMEDFSCSSSGAVGCPQKSAGKTSPTAAAGDWNVSSEVEAGLTRARKGTKRTREMIPALVVVDDGEEKVHNNNKKKAAAAGATMQTMKWDLNKGVEPFDDNWIEFV
ncbi:hypothetical protein Taro_043512 [Colocasia esculenta]|uniref:Uncharacterized protein n=1 Tax=Colocasia esculenta TaxID=4460 RepID=A0A843X1N5_COLES|nr:hypothetical protein [Colocasia esculenta]